MVTQMWLFLENYVHVIRHFVIRECFKAGIYDASHQNIKSRLRPKKKAMMDVVTLDGRENKSNTI